ncbi:glycosyltransferase [Puniceicoccaceae bacterium K14]|nr:glycosyltransferase [Puniceicoccaceae bacterium K14]
MSDYILYPSIALYIICSIAMMSWGFKTYYMVRAFRIRSPSERWKCLLNEKRLRKQIGHRAIDLPVITTQIPIYNEFNVAERIIRTVAAMDYPKDRHHIQVLDDSDDETVTIVDRVCHELHKDGYDVEVLRRDNQSGFKAGALKEGMKTVKGEFIAIFDADFVPPKDFLWRCLAQFRNHPERGLVQARWGHLNRNENMLTKAVAVGIDGHFVIEQPARSWNGLFLNFNGTAGLWRRETIEDAGGWRAVTLTEDLELSYRAQLKGWSIYFHHDLVVPAEIPATYEAFKSQQFRWAKGSIQTALLTLPRVLKAKLPFAVKFNAALHLTQYSMHVCMLLVALLSVPILIGLSQAQANLSLWWLIALFPLITASIGPSRLYMVSQAAQGRSVWQNLKMLPFLMITGFGISISNTHAVIDAIRGINSPFVRTPKKGQAQKKSYSVKRNNLPWIESAMGVYTFGSLILALATAKIFLAPYLFLYSLGFFTVGLSSLQERRRPNA